MCFNWRYSIKLISWKVEILRVKKSKIKKILLNKIERTWKYKNTSIKLREGNEFCIRYVNKGIRQVDKISNILINKREYSWKVLVEK